MEARRWLEQLDRSLAGGGESEALPALALLAGRDVELDEGEVNAARRRALLLLATGGDPRRGFDLDGRAVSALAADLDAPNRRLQLERNLAALRSEADPFPTVSAALDALLADPDLAWRALAAALIADDLEEDDSG